jgi:integrase
MLHLPGEHTKNGQDADIPLRPDLIEDLRHWVAVNGKKPSDRVFVVPERVNKILRRDLAWAGIPYRDDNGRFFDFHSLRYCTASHMGKAKVTPRVAQEFMRHSNITLTLQTYNDANLSAHNEALAALPDLPLTAALALPSGRQLDGLSPARDNETASPTMGGKTEEVESEIARNVLFALGTQ